MEILEILKLLLIIFIIIFAIIYLIALLISVLVYMLLKSFSGIKEIDIVDILQSSVIISSEIIKSLFKCTTSKVKSVLKKHGKTLLLLSLLGGLIYTFLDN